MSAINSATDSSVDEAPGIVPHRRAWLLGSILVGLLIASRFAVLAADPPPDMSRDYLSDEGWWAHNARQHAVFGHWVMDEHNAGLMWSPLYSGALRSIYQFVGHGLWQTRSLAAVSGIATCFVVYACMRALHGHRAAFYSTLLLATNYFYFSYNRVAFVESFQAAMLTATMMAVALSVHRSLFGIAAGILFGFAILSKISALSFGIVFAAFWAWQWLAPFNTIEVGRVRAATLRAASGFAAGAVAVIAIAWLLLALPNGISIADEAQKAASLTANQSPFVGIATLGIGRSPQGLFTSRFIVHTPLLLAAVVCVATRQLVDWRYPISATTRLAWCWLILGLMTIGVRSHFDEDRRYLVMLPAITILVGLELARSGITIVSRQEVTGRPNWKMRLVLASVVAVAMGLALRVPLADYLLKLRGPASPDHSPWIGQPAIAAAAWLMVSGIGFGMLLAAARWLPAGRKRVSAGVVLVAIIGLNVAKTVYYFSHLTFALPQAAQALAEIGEGLPGGRPVVLGDTADTLGLGTEFFTFIIRRWDHNRNYLNLDGWERFDPSIVLGSDVPPGFIHVRDLHVAPDWQGQPQVTIPVWVRASASEPAERTSPAP